ncbi:putative membrane protein [Heliorestis convoluta]|uniref:Putative membrane protein n=1 Tax=Heliorestis convoluta TaxID=356322 RepID=A0A5Q2MX50_9FIRM|nr:putative membrane protein [Heliorestis convoluta]
MSYAGHGFFGGLRNVAGLVIALIVIGAFFPDLFGYRKC